MTTNQTEPETVTVATSTLADLRDANTLLRRRERAMRELIATHIAQGLDSRDGDRWRAAITLTQALDNADCNVDQLVDQWLEDHGWDPRAAYKALPGAATAGDPWQATPSPADGVPEPVRRVIAGHVAEALLESRSDEVRTWTRSLTHELCRTGVDLREAITARFTEIAVGHLAEDHPF